VAYELRAGKEFIEGAKSSRRLVQNLEQVQEGTQVTVPNIHFDLIEVER